MKTIGDLLKSAGIPAGEDLAAGQIEKIEIYRERQTVRIRTVFPRFVPYKELQTLNAQLHDRILPDMRVELAPRFPAEQWSTERLLSVIERVRELDASVNGTFRDCTAEIRDNKLILTLFHGGAELMLTRKTDQ
ncbi:MAG: hypothetical protein J6I98_02725, partial [Clostridia bacterium]|nr:hypothetical protein [Clostridia bacterium]